MTPRILLVAIPATLVACQSSGPSAVQRGSAGEEVSSVCFNRQLNNWQPLSRNAIVIERGMNEYYRLTLSGACDATRSGLTLATESRSGICLDSGDEVDFSGDFAPSCLINSIHAWTPAPE